MCLNHAFTKSFTPGITHGHKRNAGAYFTPKSKLLERTSTAGEVPNLKVRTQ